MTSNDGVQLIRNLIREFFNSHNPAVAPRFFTPDFRWHGGSVGEFSGVENYAQAMTGFWCALPDAHATELDAFQTGDRVVARFVVEATHKGPLWGVAPTNRKTRWDATMIYRLENGKIAEQWAAEDWTAILRDVGVFTPPFGNG